MFNRPLNNTPEEAIGKLKDIKYKSIMDAAAAPSNVKHISNA